MNEAAEGAAAPDNAAPKPITADEFEGCRSAIASNIEQGHADPLLGLSAETEEQLLRLAYTDLVALERLERILKAAIRDANHGEPAAKAFNLGTYKRGATQLRKQLQEANARRARLRERNLRLVQGGKGSRDEGGTDVDTDGAKMSVAAAMEASSVFLRAGGCLRHFRGGRVWFDEFHGAYFTDWDGTETDSVIEPRKVDDAFLLRVHRWLLMLDTKLGQSGTTNTEKALYDFANDDIRNEPKEWLVGLTWDGTERLATLLERAYGAPHDNTGYHAAVGRCWFVSLAARIMEPGSKVDTCPVFFGPQGTGKSTSLAVIGGKWYRTINTSADGKDFFDALRGVLVAEIAEFDAFSSNRVENSRIKTLLSTAVDSYRLAYGRTTMDFKRTAVLHATTNDAGWHRDETGGRRFWPIHCQGLIDVEYLRENRDQLFAEARVRYERGESWFDVPREAQEALIDEHYSADPWEDRIRAHIAASRVHRGIPGDKVPARPGNPASVDPIERWGTLITMPRLLEAALNIEAGRQSRRDQLRCGAILRRLGWKPKTMRFGEETVRAWIACEDGQGSLDLGE